MASSNAPPKTFTLPVNLSRADAITVEPLPVLFIVEFAVPEIIGLYVTSVVLFARFNDAPSFMSTVESSFM